ncbi:Ribosomal protein S11-like protein [Elsinoe fawcettii]|nr:Ribosomal protein S11-like protein [Elsinoe fawcettii]
MSRKAIRLLPESICASCRKSLSGSRWSIPARTLTTTVSRQARAGSVESALAPPDRRPSTTFSYTDFDDILGRDMPAVDNPALLDSLVPQPHRFHVYATKHNTHITFTAPPPPPTSSKGRGDKSDAYKPPEPNKPLMSFATGMIGFRKAGRGTYDAAYQLASYVLKQIQERGLLREIKDIEVVLRGFGAGREAVTKAILGQEGRFVRPKITAVTDATRLKFGGSRSPNPRRLG